MFVDIDELAALIANEDKRIVKKHILSDGSIYVEYVTDDNKKQYFVIEGRKATISEIDYTVRTYKRLIATKTFKELKSMVLQQTTREVEI